PKGEQLFNGRDLSNWSWVSQEDGSKIEEVWSVKDGLLHCKGKPVGYIRTQKDDYQNYELTVEWRWPEGTTSGNNGVLVHTSTPGALGVWPKSIEVQLASGNAGDFWVIGTELDVENEEARKKDRRHLNLTDDSEKPIGEWNQMVITCKGDEVLVKVNGEMVNHATNCSVTSGAISLQSEGAPIEFRKVELKPLAAK
ncbi:MAG: 3-keto-disaccharide hydrolase, partial [Planctomycetaceae bacterium]